MRPFFYGLGELSPTAIDLFLKIYLLLYFNQIRGLSASGTSLVISLSVLWDALIDPWIGALSDRYREKKGDRKILLYVAALLITLFFYGLWRIPSGTALVPYFYLFILCALLNSSLSLFSVPFYAIANDLENDNLKRRTWIGWRLIFFNVGSIVGLAIPAYFLTAAAAAGSSGRLQPEAPYLNSVTTLAVMTLILSVCATYGTYFKIKSKPNPVASPSMSLKTIFKDKVFIQVLGAFFIVNCGLGLNSTLALYYYKDFLHFTESETQGIIISFLVIFTLAIPLWVWLTRIFDKKKLVIAGAVTLGLLTIFSFPFFKPDQFWKVFFVASVLCGLLVGVAVVMEIYLADFLNQKEIELKRSVSGQFLGLWKMASKISRAIAIGLAGPIIEISAGRPELLAIYFGGAVGLFFVSAGLIFLIPVKTK